MAFRSGKKITHVQVRLVDAIAQDLLKEPKWGNINIAVLSGEHKGKQSDAAPGLRTLS